MKSVCGRFFRRFLAGALVLAVIGAAVMLSGGVANAAPPPGTQGFLTLSPPTGGDRTIPEVSTSAGCPATADSYMVTVNGPNKFDNLLVVRNSSAGISHTGPFSVPFDVSMKAAAIANNTSLVAGEYDVTLQCIDGGTLQNFGTFTTAMVFTDPTYWHSAGVMATYTTLNVTPGPVAFLPISGSGSMDEEGPIAQWRRDVASRDGLIVNFAGSGSGQGRNDFRTGQVDFAVSGIPYDQSDGGIHEPNPTRAFGYMPIVAGGLSFIYNLKIGNQRVTNLRLSGDTLTRIFTQKITNWDDPAIQADNPGLALPSRTIVPVVRSDGADTTAQFTAWMASQHSALWDAYCHKAGRNITPCGFTSFYPANGMNSKAGSLGVVGFVAQDSSEGTITYAEYSNALYAGFPVVKVLNAANYYVEPTATNVAVALLKTKIKADFSADLSQVYVDHDPRAYPLSGYTYMIIPKDTSNNFDLAKGRTLSEFAYYSLCEGQQEAAALGSAPLPVNLVRAGADQVGQIPGSTHRLSRNDLTTCNNPTFSPHGTDLLAKNAPQPKPCDLKGAPTQCATGTGGAATAAPPRFLPSPGGPGIPGTTGTAGAAVTFTTMTGPPGAAGSVQFKDEATNIGDPVTVINGTATMTTTALTVGSHQLTAVFTPTDPTAFGPSTSQTVTFTVNAPPAAKATTTTLRVFSTPAFLGLPVISLSNVTPSGAAGTIQLIDGTTTLGTPVPVTSGFALLTTTLPTGTHSLTAVFTPTEPTAYAPSISAPVPLTVQPTFSGLGFW